MPALMLYLPFLLKSKMSLNLRYTLIFCHKNEDISLKLVYSSSIQENFRQERLGSMINFFIIIIHILPNYYWFLIDISPYTSSLHESSLLFWLRIFCWIVWKAIFRYIYSFHPSYMFMPVWGYWRVNKLSSI